MRMKEVIRQTGLSEWTIRYYMKEGLVRPREETRNGRVYSDFSEADVEDLNAVVRLRSARFSLEEIRTMQQAPDRIPEVLAVYTRRIQAEEQDLHRLNLALAQMDGQDCGDYLRLSRELQTRLDREDRSAYVPELHFAELDQEEATSMEEANRPRKRGTKKQLIATACGLALLLVLVVAGTLVLRHARQAAPGDSIPAEGYQSMELANGVCYLTDRTGVVSVLDLDTGKQTLAFRGPEGVSWVSDPEMQTLYYAGEHFLYAYDIAAERASSLLDLLSDLPMDYSGFHFQLYTSSYRYATWFKPRYVLAVTDNCVLFQIPFYPVGGGPLSADTYGADTYSLDRRTGEVRLLLDQERDNLVFDRDRGLICQGDTVYLWTARAAEGPDVVQSTAAPVAVDLAAGELRTISLPDGQTGEFSFAAQRKDGTILLCDTLNRVYGLVPGSDRAEHLYDLPLETRLGLIFSSDGTLVTATDYQAAARTGIESVLYRLDPEIGALEELRRFPDASVRAVVTDGARYGVWELFTTGEAQILLGDLPEG